jgi:hypothetical protein
MNPFKILASAVGSIIAGLAIVIFIILAVIAFKVLVMLFVAAVILLGFGGLCYWIYKFLKGDV